MDSVLDRDKFPGRMRLVRVIHRAAQSVPPHRCATLHLDPLLIAALPRVDRGPRFARQIGVVGVDGPQAAEAVVSRHAADEEKSRSHLDDGKIAAEASDGPAPGVERADPGAAAALDKGALDDEIAVELGQYQRHHSGLPSTAP
jgi:hypothetical protein